LAVAPNGDVFVADSAAGEVVVLREPGSQGRGESREIFASHLNLPFGIAFHDDNVYVANTNEVLRFRCDPKTSKRLSDAKIRIFCRPLAGYAVLQPKLPIIFFASVNGDRRITEGQKLGTGGLPHKTFEGR